MRKILIKITTPNLNFARSIITNFVFLITRSQFLFKKLPVNNLSKSKIQILKEHHRLFFLYKISVKPVDPFKSYKSGWGEYMMGWPNGELWPCISVTMTRFAHKCLNHVLLSCSNRFLIRLSLGSTILTANQTPFLPSLDQNFYGICVRGTTPQGIRIWNLFAKRPPHVKSSWCYAQNFIEISSVVTEI